MSLALERNTGAPAAHLASPATPHIPRPGWWSSGCITSSSIRSLHADFDLERFRHHAFFNETASRVEMHLVSLAAQMVRVAGERVVFAAAESIWTESSYKYDQERLDTLVTSAGFRMTRLWTDAAEQFWVAYLDAA